MRVLSFTQPWASLVCLGEKKIETRSWKSWYFGPILIHASKSFPKWAKECCEEEPFYSALRPRGIYAYPELACGHIIGMAELVSCSNTEDIRWKLTAEDLKEQAFGDYSPGRYGWFLENAQFLPKPVLAKGALGLWKFDMEVIEYAAL
jgi:hypothetical protein